MSQRPGGVDPIELDEGIEAFANAGSFDELEQLVHDLPVLSSPIFHSTIRQEHLRLINQNSPHLENFIPRYEALFSILHYKAHEELFAIPIQGELASREKSPSMFAPPFLAALAKALGTSVPSPEVWNLNPAMDRTHILSDIARVSGRDLTVPEYERSRGSRWNAVIVLCASCRWEWVTFRAYSIDLTVATDLKVPLLENRINSSACPQCGEILCFPKGVWIEEPPGAGDPLAALCCMWRIAESVWLYQPPPGTRRIEKNDRILEIRFERLMNRIATSEKGENSTQKSGTVRTMGVAYTIEEIGQYLNRVAESDSKMPIAMGTMITEVSQKLRSGMLSLHQTERFLREVLPQLAVDWPLIAPGNPGDARENPYGYLAQSLVAEGVAQAKGLPAGIRSVVTAGTAAGYIALGELALAEATLARADDFMAQVPSNDPQKYLIQMALDDVRAGVLNAIGRHDESAGIRNQLQVTDLIKGDNLDKRLIRQQLVSSQALSYYETQQYDKALEAFPVCVKALEAIVLDAATSTDPEDQILLPKVKYTLSGDLANWSAVLMDLADHLEIHELLQSDLPQEEKVYLLLQSGSDPRRVIADLQSVMPLLDNMFPEGVSRAILLREARVLLERALLLSEEISGWEFAGIQAHRLAIVLKDIGDNTNAERAARKAVSHSARVGDHSRIWSAECFLADCALKRGDGVEALQHLHEGAREWIRERVGQGYRTGREQGLLTMAEGALRSIALGADATSAIMIVESLKAATTASSLTSGMPIQPLQQEGQTSNQRLDELGRSREALRLKAMWSGDLSIRESIEKLEEQMQQERKTLSLRDPRFARWVDATDVDISDAAALSRRLLRLGAKTTLMGVLPLRNTVWTYMVWAEGCLVSEQSLPSLSESAGRDAYTYLSYLDEQYLRGMSQTLLGPLKERLDVLGPDDLLVVSAFDQMYHLPFSALPFKGKPLCEYTCLSVVHGIGVLEACLSRPSRAFDAILLLGGPVRPDVDSLPGAVLEAGQIADMFTSSGRKATMFRGTKATIPALKSNVGDHNIVHLACHATASSSDHEQSELMLAPDVRMMDSGNFSEDRILSELLLLPGSLVNLAACATGIQRESDAPLLAGLVPAFLVAGASSVVGSLWPIQDSTAARFQTEFYRRLLTGIRPARSLAETQRACARGALGPEMQNAAVWAAYTIYGAG